VGSRAILDHVRETQPRLVLFGHIHQPLVGRARVGRTECVNVGHFRGRRRPFSVRW
jgi:Icc-related predicted phosphoesterase